MDESLGEPRAETPIEINNSNRATIWGWILSQSLYTHNEYDFWYKENLTRTNSSYTI